MARHSQRPLSIAMIGQKGLPALHGGVERHVEELSTRLVERGHEVTVYCRVWYAPDRTAEHRGVRLRYPPSIRSKHLDAITHSALSAADTLRRRVDVVHFHAAGPALVRWIPQVAGERAVVTVHGRDWQRAKWGPLASRALRLGERMAVVGSDACIAVSSTLATTLSEEYGRVVEYVPNGVVEPGRGDESVLEQLGISAGEYALFVGRLVPEKGCHYLLDAWKRTGGKGSRRLVIAGDPVFSGEYANRLRASASADVVFAGNVYGARLDALLRNASLFVLPSDLEGLPLVLLEAVASGIAVLASDIPPNREVLGDNGDYFRAGDTEELARSLSRSLSHRSAGAERALALRDAILHTYSWDTAVDQIEEIYERVATSRRS